MNVCGASSKRLELAREFHHPNVVTIHDVGSHENLHYIIMQYIEGENLAELVKRQGGPLPWLPP